jgi:phosphoribosylamine--glycine ligase
MRHVGMRTAPVTAFRDVADALSFIGQRPRRYVYKHNGSHMPSSHNFVGVLPDGSDVIALLRSYQATLWSQGCQPDFVLMDHLDGVETGIGAYFNGHRFVGPVCLDWEHKRFFTGDMGELTGEMGTVVTYRGADRLFGETLRPMAPLLAAGGYRGYINLNTIINADGVWPLEFTCRFGYPGFAILDPLHRHGWQDVLAALCGHQDEIATRDGFAVGVVLTTPPFPYAESPLVPSSRGLPLLISALVTAEDHRHVHYGEVGNLHGRLQVAGPSGYILVATGCGSTVTAAQHGAYGLLRKIHVPNGRYRTDIGDRFEAHDAALLRQWGYLPAPTATSAADTCSR